MFDVRRLPPVLIGAACAFVLGACESRETTPAPTSVVATPAPAPAPSPAAPTYAVSGVIFETPPTASQRVPEAEVQLSGGVATGSVGDGTFTIPNVANGTYTLRVAKAGHETQTRSVTVAGGDVTGITVNLMPVPRPVDRVIDAELGPGGPSCQGTTRPCHTYAFSSHHGGQVRAFLAWNLPTADFDFEFWCRGALVEKRAIVGNTYDEILPAMPAAEPCEIHVIHASGGLMRYTLYLTYPF